MRLECIEKQFPLQLRKTFLDEPAAWQSKLSEMDWPKVKGLTSEMAYKRHYKRLSQLAKKDHPFVNKDLKLGCRVFLIGGFNEVDNSPVIKNGLTNFLKQQNSNISYQLVRQHDGVWCSLSLTKGLSHPRLLLESAGFFLVVLPDSLNDFYNGVLPFLNTYKDLIGNQPIYYFNPFEPDSAECKQMNSIAKIRQFKCLKGDDILDTLVKLAKNQYQAILTAEETSVSTPMLESEDTIPRNLMTSPTPNSCVLY